MRFLVTGGSGYIGGNLLRYLDSLGHTYVNYDRVIGKELLNYSSLEQVNYFDAVIHLAALSGVQQCEDNPVEAWRINVGGTYNLCKYLSTLRWSPSLVFASTQALDTGVYGLTKKVAEKVVLQYGGVVARLSNVYGGFGFVEKKNTLIAQLMKPNFVKLGKGDEVRDFVHVDDVVKKLVSYVDSPSKVVNIKSGVTRTVDEVIELSKQPNFPDNLRVKA